MELAEVLLWVLVNIMNHLLCGPLKMNIILKKYLLPLERADGKNPIF